MTNEGVDNRSPVRLLARMVVALCDKNKFLSCRRWCFGCGRNDKVIFDELYAALKRRSSTVFQFSILLRESS
jgi:hypothetical protein